MEAILILRDAGPDVPNPMNTEICVSLTSLEEYDGIEVESLSFDDDEDDNF